MSIFKVEIVAINPKKEDISTPPIEALVDTGSELTWLPEGILNLAGIEPRAKKVFVTATGEHVEREVGYAILSAEGHETIDEVVFAKKGDMILLGVRTLEGFSVMVDSVGHRLVTQSTLAAANTKKVFYR